MRSKSIYVKCDCGCCTLEVSKETWGNEEACYDVCILDSRYDHEANGVWNRIKRAAKALFGKPVYFNDVAMSPDRFHKLMGDLRELEDWDGE